MSRDAICQTAWDAIGPSLRLTQERFLGACQSPAAVCEESYPPPVDIPPGTVYNLVTGVPEKYPGLIITRNYTPCIAWMAAVSHWNQNPVDEPNRLPLPEEVNGPFQERPYRMLFRLSQKVKPNHAIFRACDEISNAVYASQYKCGAEENINRICRAIAYLTCQAPEDSSEREKITTYEHTEQCLKENHGYFLKAIAQVYYHAPLSYFGCVERQVFVIPTGATGGLRNGGGRIRGKGGPDETTGSKTGVTPSLQTPVMVLGGMRFLGAETGEVLSASILPPIRKGSVSLLGQLGVEASHTELKTPLLFGPHFWELGLHGGLAVGFSSFGRVHLLADIRMSASLGYESDTPFSAIHMMWTAGLGAIVPHLFESLKPMFQVRYGTDLFVGSPKEGEEVRLQTGNGVTVQLGALF